MTLWMIWAVVVTVLLAGSARAVEHAFASTGRPTRWSWVAALAAAVGLQLWSVARSSAPSVPIAGGTSALGFDGSWLVALQTRAGASLSIVERLDGVLGTAWLIVAGLATTLLAVGLVTLHARARRWSHARVAGEDVLVSPDFGPALIGILRPRIVVPRWAMALPDADLRLACLHEREHRSAGDGWLLFAGATVLALAPWNPGLWWIVRRLRAAVEIDCDARVLRSGAERRAYGTLLLDLGATPGTHRLPALSLHRPPSLLERRIRMIVNDVRPHRPAHAAAALALALVFLVAACETAPPTTPGTPETSVIRVEPGTELPLVFVDGAAADHAVLETLSPDDIDRIEVVKGDAALEKYGPEATDGVIQIFTKSAQAGMRSSVTTTDPTVFVDGVVFTGSLDDIDPDDIERIDVRKQTAGDEIRIITKTGQGPAATH